MIIGITTTFVEEEREGEVVPVERVTVEYVRRVAATGAVPVLLPLWCSSKAAPALFLSFS